jgi:hypothetical protein
MNLLPRSIALLAISIAGAMSAFAQDAAAPVPAIPPRAVPATGGASPHETISAHIGSGRNAPLVTITYGRPYSKKPGTTEVRKVWGTLVPWDAVWRLGSDEATTLITQNDMIFGDTTIPAGAYTLFMLPSEKGTSQLIINKRLGQWGIPYDAADKAGELAHIDLKKDTIEKSVDELTLAIVNDTASGGGIIKIQWETTQYSVAFKLKP